MSMLQATYPELRLLIAGRWKYSSETMPVHDPATGKVIAQCPIVTPDDLDEAVAAAQQAMSLWEGYGPQKRSDILRKAAALLRARKEQVAWIISHEQGKPLSESQAEVDRAAEIIEWDAEEGRRLYGRVIESGRGQRRMVLREPLGVIAGFSPWNAPVGSPARKLSGPLAAGCGVVLKAAEEAPACAVFLVQAFIDAGVPQGLVNLVFGAPGRTSAHLIRHRSVRGVAFTGSVEVGKQLAALCGSEMKPCVMELGGHAPVIVAADADVGLAAKGALNTKIKNAGQICTSPTRFFVHSSRISEFADALRRMGKEISIGPGLDPGTNMGPLATERRVESLSRLIADAVSKGAELHELSKPAQTSGYFMPLTVLTNVPSHAEIMRTEPFGPIMVVNSFENLDDAIAEANSLPYGLAAYAFSESDRTLEKITDGLECGNLGLNTFVASTADSPLGGVKDSGFGREGGAEGVLNYTYAKNVVKAY